MRMLLPINKHPRNNLPVHRSKKRTESNFVLAFGRAYSQDFLKDSESYSLEIAREFQLNGFGIADLVSVLFTPKKLALHAFEMKMGDWRRAIAQAYRYKYFSDSAFVVLPPNEALKAKESLSVFRSINVGLLSFDKTEFCIEKIFIPRKEKPLSSNAYSKALSLLAQQFKSLPFS